MRRHISAFLLAMLMALALFGCGYESLFFVSEGDGGLPWTEPADSRRPEAEDMGTALLNEDGYYYDRDGVALYLHQYGRLPSNYITKEEARALGWQGGSVEEYAPDMAIGGDRFGNYEGLLPEADGRTYTECDIDTHGADQRGPKRIVFSNDGLIYYTEDHYESFVLLYGGP